MTLTIQEHSSNKYTPRTYANAKSAELTVAIAADFTTAGEKCTHRAAGDNYLPLWYFTTPLLASRELYKACKRFNVKTLNVAGNGIYTLEKYNLTQKEVNQRVYDIISLVHKHYPIEKIISGGQTGVDMAGLVTAVKLGIPCVGTLPKGFIMRDSGGVDKSYQKQQVVSSILAMSMEIEEEK